MGLWDRIKKRLGIGGRHSDEDFYNESGVFVIPEDIAIQLEDQYAREFTLEELNGMDEFDRAMYDRMHPEEEKPYTGDENYGHSE